MHHPLKVFSRQFRAKISFLGPNGEQNVNHKSHTVGGYGGGGRMSRHLPPPSHHAGMKYPVRATTPHSDSR